MARELLADLQIGSTAYEPAGKSLSKVLNP